MKRERKKFKLKNDLKIQKNKIKIIKSRIFCFYQNLFSKEEANPNVNIE